MGEGLLIGLIGSAVGSAVGLWAVIVVSLVNEWSAVLPAVLLAAGPLLGLLVGVLSASCPAYRAARIRPAQAIRVE